MFRRDRLGELAGMSVLLVEVDQLMGDGMDNADIGRLGCAKIDHRTPKESTGVDSPARSCSRGEVFLKSPVRSTSGFLRKVIGGSSTASSEPPYNLSRGGPCRRA